MTDENGAFNCTEYRAGHRSLGVLVQEERGEGEGGREREGGKGEEECVRVLVLKRDELITMAANQEIAETVSLTTDQQDDCSL